MTGQFEGKVALVTGAASGIGRATALAFAREGARVVVADIASDQGQETVHLIQEANGIAFFVHCDVSRASDVEAMVASAVEMYGSLDCAVNNAGIEGTRNWLADYTEEMWHKVLAINLTGPWLCMKHELPQMMKQGKGAIVNTASVLGLVGMPMASAYTASKHGVVGLTKVAALEYASRGIRVNAVCPGFIETPMVMERNLAARTNTQTYNYITSLNPLQRLGKPEEVAEMIIWLCSDVASFVSGQAFAVDGGMTAQ